jgi:hypothetical protein
MAITSAAVRQLSDGNSQGTIMGKSSSDSIGFYNVSTVTRQQGLTPVSGTSFASLSLSSGALVSSIAIALNNLGLINCTGMSA